MKIKTTVLIILISLVLLSSKSFAATEFNMSFSTVQPGGGYKPANVVAVWVTQTNGTFVKTILRYAGGRKSSLSTWYAAAGSSDADAVMGATRANHSAPATMTATWNMKNKSGVVVPDGTYVIKLEMSDGSIASHSFNFVKDGTAGTRTNAGSANFKNISIAYVPPNAAPVAQAQSVTNVEDTAKIITLVATDAETNAMTYVIATNPVHGTLSAISSNTVTYTPATNYYGTDNFAFKAYDATSTGNTAIVSITVTPVNDTPLAQTQSVTTAEDTAKAITLLATDVETNAMTYTVLTNPVHGVLSGAAPNLTYTPATNYFGADSFTFKANDGLTDSVPATVSITVTPVNDPPVAQVQNVSTPEDISLPITLTAADAETNALSYAVVTDPAHGVLNGTAPNVTYTPATNYFGTDSFTFKANDGTSDSVAATVSITVTPVNDLPVAQNQSVSVAINLAKAITLEASDVETNVLTYAVVTNPVHGVLSGTAPNVTYTPATNYSGADSFTFNVHDGLSTGNTATVSITIAANTAPVAENQNVFAVENTALPITLAATDADFDPLTYVITAPTHGTLGSIISNLVTYTPATNYIGPDSFTFSAYDGISTGNTATVSITVEAMQYALIVNGGDGDGSYTNGAKVTITATPVPGQAFFKWLGATQHVAGVTSSTAVVTMPASAITLTASNVVDTTKPTVVIVTPKAAMRISNATYTVTGTAADNKVVTNVMVKLNNGDYAPAVSSNGWKTWSAEVQLVAGSNTVRAYSTDSAFNNSTTATVACTYVVLGNLTVQTNGSGKVTIAPTGAAEVGKTYTLTAAANTGSTFANWTGDITTTTNKVISFVMTSNKTVRANFTDNEKPKVTITVPTALQKVYGTNGDFTVRGTASDNLALSNVMVKVNGGSFVPANATTNGLKSWTLPVALSSDSGGTNTIAAYSVDTTGNSSATVTVKCVYIETGALNISTNGPGKVTVAPTGPFLLGKTYTLTAAANAGAVFSNWVGNVVGNPTGKVVMVTLNATNKIVAVTANFTDTAKPTVVITYPANKSNVMTNGLVVIRGTASDNGALSEVKYQLYSGAWTNTLSTTNGFKSWTADYVPVAGLNTSKVYSVDAQGNVSATSTVVFTYIPGAVLTVQTNGNGTITPSLNGKVLQIGSTNIMTAAAKPGSTFVDWTAGIGGSQVTTGKVVKFVMTSNLVLTANFHLMFKDPVADVLAAPQTIVVDGVTEDWADVSRSSLTKDQDVAAVISGNKVALLLNGCPFGTSEWSTDR